MLSIYEYPVKFAVVENGLGQSRRWETAMVS
jgi:hypothetical protein